MRIWAAVLLCGTLIGLVGALFLTLLHSADAARIYLIDFAEAHSFPQWFAAVIVCLIGAAIAAWLAHFFAPDAPQAAISNKPEGQEEATASLGGFTANLAGSSLAVGAGLALGPERPAIQMGAFVGRRVSHLIGLSQSDREIFIAATGGAGVATMFNSPLGCAAYTVESVLKRVDFRISAICIGIGGVAVAVTRLITARDVNFLVSVQSGVEIVDLLLCFLLGALIAILANLHVHLIMLFARLGQSVLPNSIVRAGLIGGAIGLIAWYAPDLVGTGDTMAQSIMDGSIAIPILVLIFLVRFVLGPLSLAAGTPGGYFTPVLLLGASFGSIFGVLVDLVAPVSEASPTVFALIGMAVALATVANAPFTGILLVLETTGAFSLSLAMAVAVLGAVLVGQMTRIPTLSHGLEIALKQPGSLSAQKKQ